MIIFSSKVLYVNIKQNKKCIMKTQKSTLLLSIAALLVLNTQLVLGQKKYLADKDKSNFEWLGEKVVGEHKGTIKLNYGEVVLEDNTLSKGIFNINMQSIKNTDITDPDTRSKLVGHLRSEDFFNVNEYPESKLVITNKPDFSSGSAWVKGNLTIKGKTHPIEFRATKNTVEGGIKFYANITVDRTLYDVRFGSGKFFDNLGDKTIYDEFKLKVNLLMSEE